MNRARMWIRSGLWLFSPALYGQGMAQATPQLPPLKTSVTVDVTADRTSVTLGESAKTVYTLTPADLHDYPAVTLDEALGQHAGFELFRRAPNRVANPTSEGISLRGLGSTAASRTLVLEDGAPLNDPFGGYIHWNEQPAQDIGSVTIVTGGGSDLYGSSALGGVIDVTPAAVEPTRFFLSGAGGSQSTSDLQGTLTQVAHPYNVLLAGESLRTGGYIPTAPSAAGPVDIAANVVSQAAHAELGRRGFASQRFFLTGNMLNETRSNGTPLQTNATRFWRYLGGYDTPDASPVAARARVFGSQQGYRQSFSSITSVAVPRDTESLTRLERVHTQEFGASADATRHLSHLAFVAGTDFRDIRGEDNETPIARGAANGLADTTARQRFLGGFGEVLAQAGPWSGAASLRADRASNLDIVQTAQTGAAGKINETVPPNRMEIVLSPRAGITRTLSSQWNLHASGFRAFRTPTLNELYRTGQVGQETTIANAALVSERATGFGAGTDYASAGRKVALSATYFFTEINRPVSAVLVSQTATTLTDMRENLGQIRSQGVESTLTYTFSAALSASAGYQYADALVTKFSAQPSLVGNRIPQVPAQSFTAQLRASGRRLGELTVAARAIGSSFDDSANQFQLNRFFALDVSGHRAVNRRLDAFFLVQNLTGRRPQVSRTPTLTLGSPIFAEAGVRLSLDGNH